MIQVKEISSEVIFNPQQLQELIDLDEDGKATFVKKIVNDYRARSIEVLKQIRIKAEEGQLEEVEQLVHSLKSSAAMLGLSRFSKVCGLMELQARNRKPTNIFLTTLKTEHDLAILAISEFLLSLNE